MARILRKQTHRDQGVPRVRILGPGVARTARAKTMSGIPPKKARSEAALRDASAPAIAHPREAFAQTTITTS